MIAEKLRQIQKTATATNPQGISGLTVWLKADAGLIDGSGAAITANGTEIATWQNQASGGTHYNKSGLSGAGPTYRNGANGKYGLPVVDFNGASTQGMTHADISAYSTGGVTIFTICKWTSGQVWSANDGAGGVNYPVTSYHPRFITGGDGVSSFATTNDDGYTEWNFTKFASNVGVSYEYYPYGTPSTITTAAFASRGAAQTADCIGKHAYNADWFTGQIGELIIYNRKLTDSECAIIKTYLLNRWPIPSFDNVALLLHMDGSNGSTTFTDSGPNALTVTPSGNAQISTTQSKYGGASAYLDGNGDYLTCSHATLFDFSGDFTIEGWFNFATINQYQGYSILFCGIEVNQIQLATVSGAIELYLGGSSLLSYSVASSSFVSTWTHVAVTRIGSTVKLWLNGVNVASGTRSTAIDLSGISIGSQRNNGAYFGYLNAYVDDFRIKKGEAVYTTTFTPSGPFPNP
jgi:hypothetical protein